MESSFKNIIFDFDGTLVDSIQAIWQTTKAAVKEFENRILPSQPVESFEKFHNIHTGSRDLRDLFARIYRDGLDHDLLEEMVAFHQAHSPEYFKANILFEGIRDWIISLANDGHQLFIATNNKLSNVESVFADISEDFMSKYFVDSVDYYSCSDGNGGYILKPEPDMILKLVNAHNLNLSETLLIGDDIKDFMLKQSLEELKTAGVGWGKMSIDEMKNLAPKQRPDFILRHKDLKKREELGI